jgi:hypothetical protein
MKKHQITQLNGNLSVSFFKQDGCVIAYAPALDLSSYGSDEREAQKNFTEALDAFWDSFRDSRKLDQLLESLGWNKSKDTSWQPPKVTQKEISLDKKVLV